MEAAMNLATQTTTSAIRYPSRPRYDESDPFVRHAYATPLEAVELYQTVRAVAEGKLVGAHYHGIFGAEECGAVAARIAASADCTPYVGANIDHIGMSLFETAFGEPERKLYFERAIPNLQRARSLWGSSRFPLDLFRALLDEASPLGANLLRIEGKPSTAGLVRVQNGGVEVLPHEDHVGRDVRDSIEAQQIEEQLTVVIPLSVGSSGGEPTIYPVRLGMHQYDAHRLPEPHAYAVSDDVLPPFGVTLKPQVGDVIMWDARYIHRVSAVVGGPRTTLSFFVGICRDGRIVIFS
jgi:hypothetical protein